MYFVGIIVLKILKVKTFINICLHKKKYIAR